MGLKSPHQDVDIVWSCKGLWQRRVNDHGPCAKMPKQSQSSRPLHKNAQTEPIGDCPAQGSRQGCPRAGTTEGDDDRGEVFGGFFFASTSRTLCPILRWIFLPPNSSPQAPSPTEIDEVKKSPQNFTSRFSYPCKTSPPGFVRELWCCDTCISCISCIFRWVPASSIASQETSIQRDWFKCGPKYHRQTKGPSSTSPRYMEACVCLRASLMLHWRLHDRVVTLSRESPMAVVVCLVDCNMGVDFVPNRVLHVCRHCKSTASPS